MYPLKWAKAQDLFFNPVSLVNLEKDDQPLVYVNDAFCRLTGYERSDILGLNCRFLQGPKTDRRDVDRIRQSIISNQAFFCDLLNYRKRGEPFYNRLVLLPITHNNVRHSIGMQIDTTLFLERHLSNGMSFDDAKTSELIMDKINNPLMNIWSVISMGGVSERSNILIKAFSNILEIVKSISFLAPPKYLS